MCPDGTRCTGTDDPEKSPCTPEMPPEPCPGGYSDFECIDSRRYCLVSSFVHNTCIHPSRRTVPLWSAP